LSRRARIVSVEDVFCARVAERPYHNAIIAWESCYCKEGSEETSVLRA
jgi:HD-GYP domain-containing protein (c-di-GMP phosphodiesterase class II)